jgi:hypothetical protein
MKPSLRGRPVAGALLAVALLTGCGGPQSSAVPQRAAQVETSRGYETPPNVAGTYRGSYIETRNGQTVKGRLRIVIQQKGFKIMGPFYIRGHHNPDNTHFAGKVKQSPEGALLHFYVFFLAGYDNSVIVRAHVTGTSLDGEGHSQAKTDSGATRWRFKASKAS